MLAGRPSCPAQRTVPTNTGDEAMTRWLHYPAIGALLLLGACAESGVGQTQLSQADVDKQAALTACKSYTFDQRRLANGDEPFRLAGEPRGRSIYWYEGPDRQISDCVAAKAKQQPAS
jgi:hypothetical protein